MMFSVVTVLTVASLALNIVSLVISSKLFLILFYQRVPGGFIQRLLNALTLP
jgi:hypothetical protein